MNFDSFYFFKTLKMNLREETTVAINYLRQIEKQKQVIKKLKLSIKDVKSYYNFRMYKKSNRGTTSARNVNKLKKKINSVFRNINTDLNKIGFGIGGCIYIVENNQNSVSTDFTIKFKTNLDFPVHAIEAEKCLYIKDKSNLTDKSYSLFRKGMNLKDRASSLYSIKKQRHIKSLSMGIKPLDKGYYRDPVKMIKERVARYARTLKQGEGLDTVKIKLGCDGTNISRNVKLVNFVFSVINEKVRAASLNGCYKIGIFKTEKEDYDSTKMWLPVLWDKIKELKKVFYDQIEQKILDQVEFDCIAGERRSNRFVELEINYSFCNDMKMNLIILGLKAANSAHPCMHCTVGKNNLNERGKLN